MAYPLDLKERALNLYRTSDLSQAKVCKLFSIGTTTFKQWLRKERDGESLEAQSHNAGRPGKISDKGLETIKQIVLADPCLTLSELSKLYYKKHKVIVGTSIMSRALIKLNLRHKKLSISSPAKDTEVVKKNS